MRKNVIAAPATPRPAEIAELSLALRRALASRAVARYSSTVRSNNRPIGRTFADEARRRQLVECAIEVIAEEGFAQASLARVAQRAGVAKSVVLYHFANKDELVEQVLTAVSMASIEGVPARIAAASTARDKLRVMIESLLGFVAEHRTYALAALETWNMTRSLPGRLRLVAEREKGADDIRDFFAEGQRVGEFGEFDPRVMAVMFRQAIDAAGLEIALDPDADLRAFAAELVTLFDRATRRQS
ncbi:MAG TPA: TetR/AcrR family transcriptional regulator [Pseudonocardiaceae bacterium]|nr:TetR/AcrR family transcriptional regulator [Pseudonocardiaceae bacterium]